MNWGAITVIVGLIGAAFATGPIGLVIIGGLVWVFLRG